MQIGRDFRIESDELNVVILERHVAETGKTAGQETYKPIKYYGKLEDALDCLVTLRINGTGMKDVQEVVGMIRELRRDILKALQIVRSHEKADVTSELRDSKVPSH